jgi:prepilin-type processing-associated H-X9-DG protein
VFGFTGNNKFNMKLASVSDGLSNTIAMSEIIHSQTDRSLGRVARDTSTIPAACLATFDFGNGEYYSSVTMADTRDRGARWGDGAAYFVGFQTILAPNSPSCAADDHDTRFGEGFLSANSRHPGGVNALLLDGSVRFISDAIDNGNLSADAANIVANSPYGVWGALGSKAGGEESQEF